MPSVEEAYMSLERNHRYNILLVEIGKEQIIGCFPLCFTFFLFNRISFSLLRLVERKDDNRWHT